MIKLEQTPPLEAVVAMLEYTEAKIAVEQNPLAIHLLEHHWRTYNKMADVILDNVLEHG
jgi:hypothetical protein